MKKILIILLVLSLLSFASASFLKQYYQVSLTYDQGEIEIFNVKIIDGFPNMKNLPNEKSYYVRTVDKNQVYFGNSFYFPRDVSITPDEECFVEEGVVDPSLCGGSTYYELNYSGAIVFLPYSPGASDLEIFNPKGELIIKKSLLEFSCGDKFCANHETSSNCEQDCEKKKQKDFIFPLLAGILLLIVLIFAFWKLKKK